MTNFLQVTTFDPLTVTEYGDGSPGATGPAGPAGPGVGVDVTAYGADTTGSLPMQSAWDAACTAAVAQGKNTVLLPEGTFLVAPDGTTGIGLAVPTGIKKIRGAGRSKTFVKIQSSVGDYVAVIAPVSGADISGLEIEDLTIDQNNTGNPVLTGFTLSDPLFVSKSRFCVKLTGSTTSVAVRRCRFKDMDNVNAIFVTGVARDVLIQDNAFEMGTVAVDHDHSAIYVNTTSAGGTVRIVGNTADSAGSVAGTNAARTFIETHSGFQIVENNVSRGYQKGGNLTGIETTPGEGIRWVNNKFLACRFGLQLWSSTYSTNVGPVGLSRALVSGNHIELDVQTWAAFSGGGWVNGILLDAVSGLSIEDVEVSNNTIVFKQGTYVGVSGDSVSNGIDWRRNPIGAVVDSRIKIRNNTIIRPLASGIRISVNGANFDVSENVIYNAGQGTVAAGGAVSNGFGNGVMIAGTILNSRVNRNMVIDDQGTATTNDGLYLVGAADCTGSEAVGNRVTACTNKRAETAATGGGWTVRMDAPSRSGPMSASLFYVPDGTRSTALATFSRETAVPIWVDGNRSYTKIAASITVAGAAATVVRLGVRADANGQPGALIAEATSTLDGTVVADGQILTLPTWTPQAGKYWLVAVAQGATTAPTLRTVVQGSTDVGVGSMAAAMGSGQISGAFQSSVSGALPGTFTRAGDTSAAILVGIG